MSEITRIPAEDEAQSTQLALHRKRCDMPADAMDMQLAAEYNLGGFGTVVYDRAQRAGVEPRLQAVTSFDLTDWRQSVKAVFAAGFGLLDPHLTASLYDLVYGAESEAEAARALRAFRLSGEVDYFVEIMLDALERATESRDDEFAISRRKEATEEVARLAGLLALAGEWEYRSSDSVTFCGYSRKGNRWNLADVLASGWANFQGGGMSTVLTFWAGLANQKGESVAVPEEGLTAETVLAWARAVLEASYAKEGTNSPNASARTEDGEVLLSWYGTCTNGRWVTLTIRFDTEGVLHGHMQWNSGTDRPNRFLAIEGLLASESCYDFGWLEKEPTEA